MDVNFFCTDSNIQIYTELVFGTRQLNYLNLSPVSCADTGSDKC